MGRCEKWARSGVATVNASQSSDRIVSNVRLCLRPSHRGRSPRQRTEPAQRPRPRLSHHDALGAARNSHRQ